MYILAISSPKITNFIVFESDNRLYGDIAGSTMQGSWEILSVKRRRELCGEVSVEIHEGL